LPSALTSTRIKLWLPVIAYMAMLFVFSSFSKLPTPPGDLSFYHVHIAAYAGLGALTTRAAAKGLRHVSLPAAFVGIAISTLYGVTDEYHQMFVPGRNFDVLDMAADALGSVAGAGAMRGWSIIRRRF
jgi:VanZ family protein